MYKCTQLANSRKIVNKFDSSNFDVDGSQMKTAKSFVCKLHASTIILQKKNLECACANFTYIQCCLKS